MHENTFIISTFFLSDPWYIYIIFVYTVGKIILWLYVVIHTLENNLKMRPREENIT